VRNLVKKTNAQVSIRNFRKSDLIDLLNLLPMCFTKEFEISGFDPDHVTHMVNRGYGNAGRLIRGLLWLAGREPMKFLVAEVDGKIVGTAIVNDQGKLGTYHQSWLTQISEEEESRRK